MTPFPDKLSAKIRWTANYPYTVGTSVAIYGFTFAGNNPVDWDNSSMGSPNTDFIDQVYSFYAQYYRQYRVNASRIKFDFYTTTDSFDIMIGILPISQESYFPTTRTQLEGNPHYKEIRWSRDGGGGTGELRRTISRFTKTKDAFFNKSLAAPNWSDVGKAPQSNWYHNMYLSTVDATPFTAIALKVIVTIDYWVQFNNLRYEEFTEGTVVSTAAVSDQQLQVEMKDDDT